MPFFARRSRQSVNVEIRDMPRIRTHSSTPESRRRELLLLKSSSIDGRIKLALDEAKNVVRKSLQPDNRSRLSYASQLLQCHVLDDNELIECTTILPPLHRAKTILLADETDGKQHARVSSTTEGFLAQDTKLSTTSSIYHVEMAVSDDDGKDTGQTHFITCFNIVPNYAFFDCGRRRRTSSLPSASVTFDLSVPLKQTETARSSSLANLHPWQNSPQRVIPLVSRQYYRQPIAKFHRHRFLLANVSQIDVYNIQTGIYEQSLRLPSTSVDYIALCYNHFKQELLVASTSDLYFYNLATRLVMREMRLPGSPFSLDHNSRIRYLACNSSSIYHGYFSFTPKHTSAVLARLSQFGVKRVCELEFRDATMHGLHAFEHHVGVVVRYGRYSSKAHEDYCLYVYDSLLEHKYYHIDLSDIGCITCLTGYERTLDWIVCDSTKQRILFVNQESIECVQYDEKIEQCALLAESNSFVVWAGDRILTYPIE